MKRILYETIKYFTMVAGILLSVLLIMYYERQESIRPSESVSLPDEEYSHSAENSADTEAKRDSILIPHCGDITYTLSSRKTDFTFSNPSENDCLLRVSVIRRDTSETIYVSSLIGPGNSVSDVRFFRDFSVVGDYDAMVKIDAYQSEFDTFPLVNSMVIDITIHVV